MRNDNVKNTTDAKSGRSHKKKASQITKLNPQKTKINKSIELNNSTWDRVFNAVSDWILIVDLKGKILYSNKACEKFTNIPIEKFIGQNCYKLIHGSNKQQPNCPMKTIINTGETTSSEVRLPDGKWALVTVEPIKNSDNKIESCIHIVRDISQQKMAEETLDISKQKYNNIYTQASDAITYLDSFGKIIDVNDRVIEIFGGSKKDLINKHFTKLGFFQIKDIPKYIRMFNGILSGKNITTTVEIKNKKGKKKYLECSASLIKSSNNPARIMVITEDITERKRANQAIIRSSIIIDSTTDAVITTNIDGTINSWNKGAEIIFGYNREEVIGKSIRILYKDKDLHVLNSIITDLLKGKDIPRIEVTCIDKNHKDINILLSLTTIKDKNGKITELVGISKDIINRKLTEELLRSNEAQLSNAAKIAKIGYWEYNTINKQFILNDQFYSIFGTTAEQIGGYTMSPKHYAETFIHPDDRPHLAKEMQIARKASGTNFSRQLEHRMIYADGDIGTASVRYFIRKNDDRTPPKIHGVIQDISEYKKTLELLRESEEQYRQVISTTTDATILLDAETRNFIDINKAAEILYGYNRKEFLSLKYDEITTEKDNSFRNIRKLLRKGTINVPLRYHRKKNGQVFPVEISGSKFIFKGRDVLCGIVRDITKRKEAEDKLQASELWLNNIYNSLSEAVFVITPDGNLININKTAELMFGYNEDELSQCSMEVLHIDHEHYIEFGKRIKEAFKNNCTANFEFEVKRKNGEIFPSEHTVSQLKDSKGRKLGIVSVVCDITVRKKQESALRQSEEKFRKVVENAFEGILVIQDYEKVYFNPRWLEITGYSNEEYKNIEFLSLIHPEDLHFVAQTYEKHNNHELLESNNEFRLITKSKEIKYLLAKTSSIQWENKPATLVILEDISYRKKAENALLDSEKKYRLLFENMINGFALHEVVLDDNNKPVDYKFMEINSAFEKITGLKRDDILGKKVTEVIPGIENDPADWINKYAEVALTGKEIRFEDYSKPLDKWYSVLAYSTQKGVFATIFEDITERKKVQESLRKSKSQLSNAMKIARLGYWEYDVLNDVFIFNDQFYSIYGTSVEQVGGYEMSSLDYTNLFVHPDDRYLVAESIKKVMETTDTDFHYNIEHRVIFADGSIGYIAVRSFIIKNEQEKTIRVYGANQDITERKKAEESLRKSEARYELAQRIGGIGTWEWNIETNEVYWSKEIESIFGFKEGQFDEALETVKSRIHPEDSSLWENSVRDCLEKGIEHNIKCRIIWSDGSIHWIHALGNISVYEKSVPKKMLGIVADITEQKIAEEALHKNEILLKETQKLAKLGGWEWDIVPNKAVWTDEVYNIYGVEKDFDIVDFEKVLSFYQEEDKENLRQAFEKCLNEHEPYDIEVRFVNAQGKNLWCRTIGTPVLENGQLIKLRGNLIDITKQKKAEQEHLANLRFFESMDRVNRAIQGASNLEEMMTNVLDEVLSMFDCDRACLVYPCDPEATVWQAYMERTKPEWPGVLTQSLVVPMDPEVANIFKISKDADGPVEFGPGYEEQVPSKISERFNIQSQITLALYPKFDKPWNFVIHQCSHSRVWTQEEKKIFKEIGRRLEDALTSLLISRELKESEEKYRLLVETLNEGIWKIDTKGYTTFVNSKMAQMLDYTVDEMLGKHLFSFMDEKWVNIAKEQMKERKNGTVAQHELVFQKKNGESVNMLINTSPIFDNQGNYVGALAGVADISDYVQAMEQIKTSEVRYRGLFEHMPSGVAVYDVIDGGKDFIFKEFNRAGEKYDNQSREDLIGKSIFEVRPGVKKFGLIDAFRKALKSDKPVYHPIKMYKNKRLTAWYENHIYSLPSGELVAVFDDITDKKLAEVALQENEKLLNKVGKIAKIGGWEMDLISRKAKWTKGTYDIVEIEYGKPIPGPDEHLNYYLPEYRPIVEKAINNLIEKDIPLDVEAKGKTAKGNIIWFRAIGRAIRENGICLKLVGTLQDITEQKEVGLVVQRNLKALQQAEEIALLGIFERNWQTGKGYWSDGFYRLLGLEPQQKKYSHELFMDFIHPDDRQRVNEHIQQMISLKKSLNIEFRLICSDGTIKHIHGIALNFYNVDGKPLKTIGTFQDITDKKRVEDVLNNHRRLLEKQMYLSKTLLDAIPYIAMLIKPKTREIVASNKAAIKVGAIPGKTCYETWAQKSIPCTWCKAPKLWKTGKEQHVEIEHMGTIWEVYWIHVSDDLYMHIAFDITVRKQNEERILKYQEQLKSLASQLTLTEEKERYRIATHLHDQIGQYLAVSRIKTVELLNSEISKNTENTLNLIQEWLYHAIKETRSLTYDLSSPILHELGIEKAIAAWLDDEIRNKYQINTEFYSDELPRTLDDDIEVLLFRNIRELLFNVVKHAHASKIKVSIETIENNIRIIVEDNGTGFNLDEINDTSHSNAKFGLFSIRERLENFAGHMNIDTEPNKGCKITLIAPLKNNN